MGFFKTLSKTLDEKDLLSVANDPEILKSINKTIQNFLYPGMIEDNFSAKIFRQDVDGRGLRSSLLAGAPLTPHNFRNSQTLEIRSSGQGSQMHIYFKGELSKDRTFATRDRIFQNSSCRRNNIFTIKEKSHILN